MLEGADVLTPPVDFSATPKSGVVLRRHVFVYGTLRKGEIRDINLLRPAPVWVGQGSVRGELYDLTAYPGIVLRANDAQNSESHGQLTGKVYGEIYAITPELELLLDEIEEVWPQQTGEYTKREVSVQLPDQTAATRSDGCNNQTVDFDGIGGLWLSCLLYEIALQRTVGKPLIEGGDWVARGSQV